MAQGQTIELHPPLGGVRSDVVPYDIPPGFLWRSQNIVPRYGRLRTRPGLQKAATTGPGSRISGGFTFKNAAGAQQIVAATLTKWYKLLGDAWVDISGAFSWTNGADDPQRFAVFPAAGSNWLVGVNNVDVPKKWDGTAAAAISVGGTPPIAKDCTVAGNFLVLGNVVESGVRSASRIRVSDFNDLDLWTQYGAADLTDTNDDIVAVRALTRTSFAIYKEKSIWMAWAQLGLFPFQFETMEYRPGPVSPSAVIRVDQDHYYIGTDSRIHHFNGLSAEIVSGPIEKYIQDVALATAFRSVNRARCFGFFNFYDRHLWWFYPGPNNADPTLAISFHRDTGALHLHVFPLAVTAGWEGDDIATLAWSDLTGTWSAIGPGSYPTWDSFGGTLQNTAFIGSLAGQVYRQRYDSDDDGAAIPQSWELPLKTWFGMRHNTHVDGVENFFTQKTSGPLVTVQVGTSPALAEVLDPTYQTVGSHDTTLTTRQKVAIPVLDARFWSIRYALSSSTPIEWAGGAATGWPEEVPESQGAAVAASAVFTVNMTENQTAVVITGQSFPSGGIVLYNTSWGTEVIITGYTTSGFTATFTVGARLGDVFTYKVES